jgi:polynucleotide 5'-hydroxyl-kinase GRC3/NOL9
MVIGAPDTGKTTFARYLFAELIRTGGPAAFLDGDPGQSTLGPPATMTLALPEPGSESFPPTGKTWRWFVGSTSPAGHMLPVLVGAARLVKAAHSAGVQTVVYDTSGLIDPAAGGAALKFAKIDLLQPAVVFAIQKEEELEPILQPLRRSRGSRLTILEPSAAVRRRDQLRRQSHRAEQFARHFQNARPVILDWTRFAILPFPRFAIHRLVSFEDEAGFTLNLGIVTEIDRTSRRVTVLTPQVSLERVVSIHMGDILLEPHTFRDRGI